MTVTQKDGQWRATRGFSDTVLSVWITADGDGVRSMTVVMVGGSAEQYGSREAATLFLRAVQLADAEIPVDAIATLMQHRELHHTNSHPAIATADTLAVISHLPDVRMMMVHVEPRAGSNNQ